MSANLTENDIDAAVRMLSEWKEKLSWKEFSARFAELSGKSISKQAVHKFHPRILNAFQEAKIRYRQSLEEQPELNRHLSRGQDGVKRLMAQNTRLQKQMEALRSQNNALLEQFLRWEYNAHAHGLTPDMLNRPVPSPRRGKKKADVIPIRT